MITYHFLSDLAPIKICNTQVPFLHELDEDMDLPDTKSAFNPSANMKELTIKDFSAPKKRLYRRAS